MKAWKGIAFEQVCWQHITQIKRALEIGGVNSSISSWNIAGTEDKSGAQVDLLIHRKDNIVNLCEMKFYNGLYNIDKEEELKLLNRMEILKKHLSPRQQIHLTLITTFGLVQGKYSGKIQKVVTCDELFT